MLVASPDEVARIVEPPVARFLPGAPIEIVERTIRDWPLRYGAYDLDGLSVWGATARILSQLGAVLAREPSSAGSASTDGRERSPLRWRSVRTVSRETEDLNRRLLRARDAMDRAYAEPLDVRAVAAVAHVSEAHFIRSFRAVFGETPHRYLQRRRVERSMFLLRETDRSVTDICLDVGFTSLGTFSRTFREIVGETPSALPHRARADRGA